jgi:protein tyrosine/serine phosphatase
VTPFLWLVIVLSASFMACTPTVYTQGVPNLVQVDAQRNIWRSGQPVTAESWAYLRKLGITTVVKLNFEEEGSDQGANAAGMVVVYVPIEPKGDLLSVVEPINTSNVMAAVTAASVGNSLVHCTHGQDRTGATVGALRVLTFGWTKDQAWKEMTANHFHWELPVLMGWWLAFTGKK